MVRLGSVAVFILFGCTSVTHTESADSNTDYYVQLARCNDEKFLGDLDKQIDACSWLLASEKLPEDKVNYIWFMRGNAHYKKGNYRQVISDLTHYVEANPGRNIARRSDQINIVQAYTQIALAYGALGDTKAALETLDAISNRGWPAYYAHYARALVFHYTIQDYSLAVSEYSKVLHYTPDVYDVLFHRAYAYLELEEYVKAILDFKEVIAESSYPIKALNGLAWFQATTKTKYRNAWSALEFANKLASISENPRHLDTMAAAYAAIGSYAKAVEAEEKALIADHQFSPLTEEERKSFTRRLKLYKSGNALFCPGMPECD